jgi:hypothetical protein
MGGVSYTDDRRKMVPEHRSGLRASEKELPERRSGAFRQKIHLVPDLKRSSLFYDAISVTKTKQRRTEA